MITHHELIRSLKYDPATGIWTWIIKIGKMAINDRAGHLNKFNGYWMVKIAGRNYPSARLAWFYMTGKWPPHQVDHENLTRNDDRWSNLRLATQSQNGANKTLGKTNSTGIKGVRLYRTGKFSAQIQVEKKNIHLGYFDTKERAGAAYETAARQYFGEFARK